MRRRDHAECFGQSQRVVEFLIGNPEGAFVGQKNFEAANPALDDFLEIALRFLVIARYSHVKSEVASALPFCLTEPKLEGLERLFIPGRTNHFNKRRGAAQ